MEEYNESADNINDLNVAQALKDLEDNYTGEHDD
tara:strand:+ start:2654 stop:2755 length:102 start_codon:yes stop_codon:yes gene_type:complete